VRAVSRFERSGRTHRDFCEREGLKLETFRAWLYRVRAERAAEEPRFVEVTTAAPKPSVPCRVRLGLAEIEFAEVPDATYLAALVAALGAER
jgi:hypothetical protein